MAPNLAQSGRERIAPVGYDLQCETPQTEGVPGAEDKEREAVVIVAVEISRRAK